MYKEYSSFFEQQDKLPQFSVIYKECFRVKPDLAVAWKIQIRKIYLERAETMHKDHSGPSFVQQTMLP
ncbi:hypothetical protein L6164_017468 [Bauhinia variegata]|uniref:Uncharacterized protein n=1 Tax=Bauhinia variegata TaxID=167791 RepID=A0ACB9N8L2_BAUVA|nr:hypothetical protein L6164_017468 [Bauhinia variegata]